MINNHMSCVCCDVGFSDDRRKRLHTGPNEKCEFLVLCFKAFCVFFFLSVLLNEAKLFQNLYFLFYILLSGSEDGGAVMCLSDDGMHVQVFEKSDFTAVEFCRGSHSAGGL